MRHGRDALLAEVNRGLQAVGWLRNDGDILLQIDDKWNEADDFCRRGKMIGKDKNDLWIFFDRR